MKPQKALHLYIEKDKKKPKYIGHHYMLFQKYDGWYGYLEHGKMHSRAGRVIPSLEHLNFPVLSGRLIFEILIHDVPEFHILNGILNRKKPCNNAYFKVHDLVTDVKTIFGQRFENADKEIYRLGDDFTLAPPLGMSYDPLTWQQAAEKVWSMNGEGIILKRLDAPYSAGKRNADLMKIKEEVTAELLVTGLAQGKSGGKYAGTLGTLVCRDKTGKEHNVSGMTDAQRDEWYNAPKATKATPHPILGQVIEIKAMKRLKDGSFREPRFKAIRFDKDRTELD